MGREVLVDEFLKEIDTTTREYYNFLTKPREYIHGVVLHMRELELLKLIAEKQSPNISELAEDLNITSGAVSQAVTRLLGKNLVIRKNDDTNKRYSVVSLTPLGERIYKIDREIAAKLLNKVFETSSHFSDDDLKIVIESNQLVRIVLDYYDKTIKASAEEA